MNLLGLLENGLFAIGQVLRFPVMSLLWLCVLAVCFMAGTFLVDYLTHRRKREGFDIKKWLAGRKVLGSGHDAASLPAPLDRLLADMNTYYERGELRAGGIEHLVLEAEERLRHTLNGSRILVKVAPSLGLVGTLIPMGASLASMAAGNLEAMASEMVVAFTTTIIGLACGTAAYVINVSRQSWVNQIIREQRFLAERALTELGSDIADDTDYVPPASIGGVTP